MARLPRLVLPNQPLHIMHRGNNRQDIFENEEDMARILSDIKESLSKADCHLHAYVIMTNHLHLLLTPKDKDELTVFMQLMTNRYVKYFNAGRKSNSLSLLISEAGEMPKQNTPNRENTWSGVSV